MCVIGVDISYASGFVQVVQERQLSTVVVK